MTKVQGLLAVGIAAFGVNAGIALAHPENMPGHDNMAGPDKSSGEHKATDKMTPELKKDMADMYQKMADCMRGSKTFDQCSQEAMKNCPVVQKTGHCPINEGAGPMMGNRPTHEKKDVAAGKTQPPKPDDQKHKGHD